MSPMKSNIGNEKQSMIKRQMPHFGILFLSIAVNKSAIGIAPRYFASRDIAIGNIVTGFTMPLSSRIARLAVMVTSGRGRLNSIMSKAAIREIVFP